MGEWVTSREAQELLRISKSTLHRWIRVGKLRPHRLEGAAEFRFKRSEVEALITPANERK